MKSLKVIGAMLLLASTAASANHGDRDDDRWDRDDRWGVECERGEAELKLYEKFSTRFDDKYDFRVTTEVATGSYNDNDEVLGCILKRKPRGVASKKVYECLAFDGRNYMISSARNCEGEDRIGTLGYFLLEPAENTVAIYRCFDGYTHSAWTELLGGTPCEGLGTTEGISGYIYDDAGNDRRSRRGDRRDHRRGGRR